MYEIIATDDFIQVMSELPLRFIGVLTKSFLSVRKADCKEIEQDNTFLSDLLEQIREQELE